MTLNEKLTSFAFATALVLVIGIASIAYANPSYFAAGVTTNNAASSTPAYLVAGVSTSTTPVFDTSSTTQSVRGGATYKTDSAGLLVQFTGSSTASILTAAVEYSQDCIDWYRNFVLDLQQPGTTTSPYTVGSTPFSIRMQFASTTLAGTAVTNANSTVDTAALTIPTPFRCTRVVFSLTGGNGAVWSNIVPIKESP